MPEILGVVETSLYVADLERAGCFYEALFGFPRMLSDDRMRGYAVADQQVLLLFQKGGSTQATQMPGGVIPPHDGAGRLHLAFRIAADDVTAWEQRLTEHNVTVESRVICDDSGGGPGGGVSLYFRDPDGHLIELITPGCWAVY